ncbi:hypothetical protein ABBQ32_003152 [Trebouxia sp. C0010 RCD-2024]
MDNSNEVAIEQANAASPINDTTQANCDETEAKLQSGIFIMERLRELYIEEFNKFCSC